MKLNLYLVEKAFLARICLQQSSKRKISPPVETLLSGQPLKQDRQLEPDEEGV